VNFLRGQSGLEATIFRDRQFALGDTVNAVPLYVSKPHLAYADLTSVPYTTWADSLAGRKPVLYVGANDGMLHAFDVGNGNELWAYIPRIVAPNLWKLAEMNYASLHSFFVDGSPQSSDVWDGSAWRTILVGGLNSGGRGYYALDITNPASPQALWEFCSDSTLCPISDVNLGFTYGNPVITKRPTDGRWVVLVTSGYNNVSPGDGVGRLYVLDAITGAILQTISTGVGSTTTPSGFGKINVWSDNYTVDNTGTTVYGGDMLGNLFKIDLTSASPTALLLGKTFDASGRPQPITTKPEIALVQSTYRVLFVGTGRYFGTSDLTDAATQTPAGTSAWQQSLYAFKDTGTSLGNLRNASGMVHQIISSVSGSTTKRTISPSGTTVNWSTQTGWWVDFNLPDSPGERVNVDPQLVLGTLVINTNVPGGSACSIGGDSWAYQFDYLNGTYVSTSTNQLLGVKTTGSLTVGLVVYQLQKGSLIGQAQQSDTTQIQYSINTTPGATSHRRTSWRELSR